jgi:hypothetical protein
LTFLAPPRAQDAVARAAVSALIDLAGHNFTAAADPTTITKDTYAIGYGYWHALVSVFATSDPIRAYVWQSLNERATPKDSSAEGLMARFGMTAPLLRAQQFVRTYTEMLATVVHPGEPTADDPLMREMRASAREVLQREVDPFAYPVRIVADGMKVRVRGGMGSAQSARMLRVLARDYGCEERMANELLDRLLDNRRSPTTALYNGDFSAEMQFIMKTTFFDRPTGPI